MIHTALQKLICVCVVLLTTQNLSAQTSKGAKPFTLGESVEITSKQLGEKRTLNVYLPEGYHSNDTSKYRVIYLLDGSAGEDFVHICGIVQFFEMMQLMPKTIVVGIANIDRKRDYTFPTHIEKDKKAYPTTGGSEKFIAFVEQELEPYITQHYRTAQRTLIGQSLGGLVATEMLLKRPNLFDDYIIVSPSLWWDNQSLLNKVNNMNTTNHKTIYVAVGKEGDVMEADARKLAELLRNNKHLSVTFVDFAKETHATILHNAVYEAFKTLYSINYGK